MIATLERTGPGVEDGAREREDPLFLMIGYGRMAAALTGALSEAGRRCFSTDDYEGALRDMERWPPDVVLLGPDAGPESTLEFVRRARMAAPQALVLYLAQCQDVDGVTAVIEAGADDVVCPPHSASAIIMREHVLRHFGSRRPSQRGPQRQVTVGPITADLPTRQVIDGGRPFSLSGREFELLVKLMEARGNVVAREELFEDIWGPDQGSEAALDATVHRLRRRLEDESRRPEIITTVRGVGYRLDLGALAGEGGSPTLAEGALATAGDGNGRNGSSVGL